MRRFIEERNAMRKKKTSRNKNRIEEGEEEGDRRKLRR